MEIIYNWVITSMSEKPKSPDGLIDVVIYVYWRRDATTIIDGKTYNSTMAGCYGAPSPSPEDFTPYEDLTFEQVCGWLDAGLNVESIDADLAINLENQVDPPVISLPLPWNAVPSTTTTTTTTL
jgi:hypothetical protein